MGCTIEEAKARHASGLLELPGVVSVGLGLDAEGRPVIVVGLDGPRPETCARLPGSLEGHPVRSEVIGAPSAQGRSRAPRG
jgi:hypothetical protein